jgi:hypothetical protein
MGYGKTVLAIALHDVRQDPGLGQGWVFQHGTSTISRLQTSKLLEVIGIPNHCWGLFRGPSMVDCRRVNIWKYQRWRL